MANRVRDLTGKRFGRLVGIARAGSDPHGSATWSFRCDCGAVVERTGSEVSRGKSLSCGCLREDLRSTTNRTHGEWGSAEWHAWSSMRQRCGNERHQAYARYGGRGITVCPQWTSFESFLADMGRRPSRAHSLDRIDNDGGYEPGNVRWATRGTQNRNRRTNRVLVHDEEALCVSEWAERIGLTPEAILRRLKAGWSVSDAVTRPRAYALPSGSPLPR